MDSAFAYPLSLSILQAISVSLKFIWHPYVSKYTEKVKVKRVKNVMMIKHNYLWTIVKSVHFKENKDQLWLLWSTYRSVITGVRPVTQRSLVVRALGGHLMLKVASLDKALYLHALFQSTKLKLGNAAYDKRRHNESNCPKRI